jgi:hypothetical protein
MVASERFPKSRVGHSATEQGPLKRLREVVSLAWSGLGLESRAATRSYVREELDRLQAVSEPHGVLEYLARSLRAREPYKVEAAVQRLTQLGLAHEAFRVAGFDSSANGMELFRREVLMRQMGFDEQNAMRALNDVSYIAEEKGHLNLARKYRMRGDRWYAVSEDERVDAVVQEKLKLSPEQYLRWDRFAWGYETPNREYHLSPVGRRLLLFVGEDLAKDRMWEKLNADAKSHLAQPQVIEELRAATVADEFIDRLEDFATTSGSVTRQR